MSETKYYKNFVFDLIKSKKKNIELLSIIDVGCGHSPLTNTCDTFDLPKPYNNADPKKIKYHGDVRNISDIVKEKYDVVFSSHLLEDFKKSDLNKIFLEFEKILKEDGIIILLLPDQKRYLNHSKKYNIPINKAHKYDNFGLNFIKEIIEDTKYFKCFYSKELFDRENEDDTTYNLIIGIEKSSFLKVFTTEFNKTRGVAGTLGYYMDVFFKNTNSYKKSKNIEDCDLIFCFIEYTENFVFDKELLQKAINLKKPIIIFDYVETGNKHYFLGKENLFCKNEEWISMGKFLYENKKNIKIYFKREYNRNVNYKKYLFPVFPIEFLGIQDCIFKYPIVSESEFNKKNFDIMMFYGFSHLSRLEFDKEISESNLNSILRKIDHDKRIPIEKIFDIQNKCKISVSLDGAGKKCFRDSESCVNSIMAIQDGDIEYSYPWKDNENCIVLPNKKKESYYNSLDCKKSIEKINNFLNKNKQFQSKVYFNCILNSYNYYILNYFEKYLCKKISKYLNININYNRIVCCNKNYEDVQGWFDFEYFYKKILDWAEKEREMIFVEVGSWRGASTSFMAEGIVKSGKNINFFAVDTWEGSETEEHHKDIISKIDGGLYSNFIKNIKDQNLLGKVIPMKMDSSEASKYFDFNSVDFVFLDADHRYEFVKKDIQHWFPKVKNGGIIAGHDYYWDSVKSAVNDFFNSLGMEIKEGNYGCWYVKKNNNILKPSCKKINFITQSLNRGKVN